MAADARPYKSKEQDGNGNEIILRDQQLVEQSSQTTMASTEYFEIVDVDGRMAKIPKDNMISVVREALGSLLNGLADQTTVAKFLTLNGNTLGASAADTAASVLGALPVVVDESKTAIELAKDFFSSMSINSVRYIETKANVNCFALILKDTATTGRIELYTISNGNTTVYRKGYTDNDWVTVS